MQDYKTWVSQHAGKKSQLGRLAQAILNDTNFPKTTSKAKIVKWLSEIGISMTGEVGAYTIFLTTWRQYEAQAKRRPREASIEHQLVKAVKTAGGECLKFVSPGVAGVPDRICLFPGGRIVFVEVKAPGEKPRPLQVKRIERLRELGFQVEVLDDPEKIEEVMPDEVHSTPISGARD